MQKQNPNNWYKVKLGDLLKDKYILEIQDGNHGEKHPKQSDYVKAGERIPFLMANDLESGQVDLKNCNYISKGQAEKLRIGFSKEGDVLLTHKGNLGRVAIVPKNKFEFMMLTPQVTYYRVNNERLDRDFLKYSFLNSSFQGQIQTISPQSTRPYVGITAQRDLEIYFNEDIQIQRNAVSTLAKIDGKIEVNNKIAKTLEEMAQSIFKEWFSSEEGAKYTLLDVADYVNGGVFGKIINKEKSGLPLLKIADLNRGITDNTEWIDKEVPQKYYVNDGNLLFSWSGSVGIYIWDKGKAILNQHIFNVLPRDGYSLGFVYFLLKNKLRIFKHTAGAKATTMGHIKKEHLRDEFVFIPKGKDRSIFDALYRQLVNLKTENQKLAAVRDLLLPKLMKGEIKV